MPNSHALLGPSSAHRWLICTPSARLEEGLPDTGSAYAAEGTLAHRLGELLLRTEYECDDISEELAEVEADPQYSIAMLEHMVGYADFVRERAAEVKDRCGALCMHIEQRVDFSEYVPDGVGTADCVILADGLIDVIDLKYGAGIPVKAEDNPQMKLYALGCLSAFDLFYDITDIRMTIYQPRLDSISTAVISRGELEEWAENFLKPRAALAYAGGGSFAPSEATCKWCKARALCKARAKYQLELAVKDFQEPALMDKTEIAEVLTRIPDLLAWANKVKEYAEDAAVNHGVSFPGWKLVEGRANRRYVDEGAIARLLKKAGFAAADIYKPKELLGITAMEKLVGVKKLEELAGCLIEKSVGAPTLVPESDKRPELNTAAKAVSDFEEDIPLF